MDIFRDPVEVVQRLALKECEAPEPALLRISRWQYHETEAVSNAATNSCAYFDAVTPAPKDTMENISPNSGDVEYDFLDQQLDECSPERVTELVRLPTVTQTEQLIGFLTLTVLVGVKCVYDILQWGK